MKAILALHAEGVREQLLDPDFHASLAVDRIQVNVDDEAVAPAMRLGPGPQITAVLSLWADDVATAIDVVRRLDPTVHAWAVNEREPLPPPPRVDGERTDALANFAFLRRPESMTHEEWLTVWLESHTQVAIDTQGTFGYVQNPVIEPLVAGSADVAGIVEELFPMAAVSDPHAHYGSGGDRAELKRRFAAMMESCARFGADQGLDLVPTSRYTFG
ncbi:hypothetical protein BJ980_002542 [Nocardioides daedukensis]|uniref:EthD domain-containing protein n=1 Tax=Nocardioides daedukensis TaxID=634462 RepID=A0A7Y9S4K7_9ACTN|nr:EthD domain-containing protein [Nocardioides daedukensis]NYG59619.1 hypothetical protein [Nocardioides daedukensis]